MKRIIIIIFGLCSFVGNSQNKKTFKDSINIPDYQFKNQFFTIGTFYNTSESLSGIQIGNGIDEQPIIHFEDLTANVLYKVNGQTDFKNNYSVGGELSWNYPFIAKLSILSLNFNQIRTKENDFFQRNIGVSARRYLNFIPNLSILAKFSHQKLNKQNNIGIGLGLQNRHRNIYYGITTDYFKNYYNYSAFLQGLIFKRKISLRLVYDRIDKCDFFNIGINYVIIKTTANTVHN